MASEKDFRVIDFLIHWIIIFHGICRSEVEITVGVLQARSVFERTASAISIAIEKFQQDNGWLRDFKFVYKKGEEGCDTKIAVGGLTKMYHEDKPDVVFGPACGSVLEYVGMYAANWNIPIFTPGGSVPALGNKTRYNTMVCGQSPSDRIARGYSRIMYEFGWNRVAMLTSGGWCSYTSPEIYKYLILDGVDVIEWIRADDSSVTLFHINLYLDRLREKARIILVCIRDVPSQNMVLKQAYKRGMSAPDYSFILFRPSNYNPIVNPWYRDIDVTEDDIAEWKVVMAALNFKGITIEIPEGEQYEPFYDLIPIKLAQPPWNFNYSLENGVRGSYRALYLYDMVWTYLDILNETINTGKGPEYYRNGSYMLEQAIGRTVDGIMGKFQYDETGSRLPNVIFWSFNPPTNQMEQMGIINVAETWDKRFQHVKGMTVHWEGSINNEPPLDTPTCGFVGELCGGADDSGSSTLIIGIVVAFCTLLVIGGVGGYFWKRKRDEDLLTQMKWKVNYEDLQIGEKRVGSMVAISQKNLGSTNTLSDSGAPEAMNQLFTEVATYKANLTAIIRVDKQRMVLDRKNLLELHAMKDMKHDNIADFVGACCDPPNICYLMQYCQKGSLQDVIENTDIALDWDFKASLISDLCKGLEYIHNSDLESHGQLKSSNCLIDSRWQLKITSYGLHAFRSGRTREMGEYEKYKKLLWTAPELLRSNQKQKYGTRKGDIYSYAIIVHEVVYRCMPFGLMEPVTPKDVISMVTKESNPPHRPPISKGEEGMHPGFVKLMEMCWDEDPTSRPTCSLIGKQIRAINHGKEIDIMDTIIDKLEKYANNLEEIVSSRTNDLIIEKKKTDSLLYRMLPKSAAEKLKMGKVVEAELFDEVTIYFSDIVGFTQLSLGSTPLEIVTLLNDLYNMFDDLIGQQDVYKVETIGDSYMVVSGLPTTNGKQHVGEIATLALELMSAAHTNFKIRHRPTEKLQLRIGFHTGPCAAGVVGLSMPRYCLFGDTVNMASRMETNGKALMIHMSKYAYAALVALSGYEIAPRGEMAIKGKGMQMTYWLTGKKGFTKPLPAEVTNPES